MAILSRRRVGLFAMLGLCLVVVSFNVLIDRHADNIATTEKYVSLVGGHSLETKQSNRVEHAEDSNKTMKKNKSVSTKDEDKKNDSQRNASIKDDMLYRRYTMAEACAELKNPAPSSPFYAYTYLEHMILNEQKRILYCYVPKVANTNFRRVFLALQGVVGKDVAHKLSGYDIYSTHALKFIYLEKFDQRQRQKRLKEYKKFLFVRDPLERLLSGFRNKYFHPNFELRQRYYNDIHLFYTKFTGLAERRGVRTTFENGSITFHEFLTMWSDMFQMGEKVDEHFLPYNDLCRPCKVHYDYIGKYETLDEDANFIFESLGVDVKFPGKNDNYSGIATSRLVEHYYKNIPNKLLKKVWNILKVDFTLFDYPLPMWFREKILN